MVNTRRPVAGMNRNIINKESSKRNICRFQSFLSIVKNMNFEMNRVEVDSFLLEIWRLIIALPWRWYAHKVS